MIMLKTIRNLWRNSQGASALEFALLAPFFFGLLFGVVSIGIYMQNYNAIRSLATNSSRFATVEFQKNTSGISTSALENNIESMGVSSPYFLNPNQLSVSVVEVTPSSVNGARQFTLSLSYELPQITGGIAVDALTLTHSRPIFVLKS